MKRNSYYNSNLIELKNKLLKYKSYYEKQLKGLNWITRVYKKDWSEFQAFLKNFSCQDWISLYRKSYPFEDYYYIRSDWQEISIKNYSIDENFIKEIEKSNPERIIKESFLKDRVLLNPNEFYQEIQKEKQYRINRINSINKELDFLENKSQEIEILINPILEYLDKFDYEFYDIRELFSKTIENYFK